MEESPDCFSRRLPFVMLGRFRLSFFLQRESSAKEVSLARLP
jgi:hypothetical protein